MDLLTVEMKTMLAKKLLFTLNFILTTNENLFKIFDLQVLDIIDGEVVRFDLIFREENDAYISFKRLTTGDIVMVYQLISSSKGITNKFEIFVDRHDIYREYYEALNKLFEIVTEMEREEQFQKMNSSINRILKYK